MDSTNKSRLTAALLLACLVSMMSLDTPAAQARDEESEFDQIAALLQLSNGSRVADVGAGGGAWTMRLAKRVGAEGHVFSTEVKQELVSAIRSSVRARGLKNVTVIQGGQDDTGLTAGSCDAVLLRLVYHAFRDPERMRNSLTDAVRVAGLVLIIDFRPAAEQLIRDMQGSGYLVARKIEKWQGQDGVYAVLFKKKG